jgi:hypothetical protein
MLGLQLRDEFRGGQALRGDDRLHQRGQDWWIGHGCTEFPADNLPAGRLDQDDQGGGLLEQSR